MRARRAEEHLPTPLNEIERGCEAETVWAKDRNAALRGIWCELEMGAPTLHGTSKGGGALKGRRDSSGMLLENVCSKNPGCGRSRCSRGAPNPDVLGTPPLKKKPLWLLEITCLPVGRRSVTPAVFPGPRWPPALLMFTSQNDLSAWSLTSPTFACASGKNPTTSVYCPLGQRSKTRPYEDAPSRRSVHSLTFVLGVERLGFRGIGQCAFPVFSRKPAPCLRASDERRMALLQMFTLRPDERRQTADAKVRTCVRRGQSRVAFAPRSQGGESMATGPFWSALSW